MPPEGDAHAAGAARVMHEARARLREVATLYGEVEAHVAASDWPQVGAVLRRLDALLPALGEFGAAHRAASPRDDAAVREIDALVRAVLDAHARTLRHADAARQTAATALASANQGRAQAARYRREGGREPVFQSRTV
jgi:hypothetical protein